MKETDRKIAIFMDEPLVFMHDDCGYMSKKPLHYDYLDWNKLMPVVDKIDKITLDDGTYFRTNINGSRNRTHCFIYKYHPGASVGKEVSEGHEDSKLDSVYNAVVVFITWYNTTKRQEQTPDPEQSNESSKEL